MKVLILLVLSILKCATENHNGFLVPTDPINKERQLQFSSTNATDCNINCLSKGQEYCLQ